MRVQRLLGHASKIADLNNATICTLQGSTSELIAGAAPCAIGCPPGRSCSTLNAHRRRDNYFDAHRRSALRCKRSEPASYAALGLRPGAGVGTNPDIRHCHASMVLAPS